MQQPPTNSFAKVGQTFRRYSKHIMIGVLTAAGAAIFAFGTDVLAAAEGADVPKVLQSLSKRAYYCDAHAAHLVVTEDAAVLAVGPRCWKLISSDATGEIRCICEETASDVGPLTIYRRNDGSIDLSFMNGTFKLTPCS